MCTCEKVKAEEVFIPANIKKKNGGGQQMTSLHPTCTNCNKRLSKIQIAEIMKKGVYNAGSRR